MQQTVNIIGAGIYGLSLAVALSKRGYEVTVFDKNDYEKDKYENFELQAASVDQNKIFRASYGKKLHYQRLAMEAREEWEALGEHLFVPSGMLRVQPTESLGALEQETLVNMQRDGFRQELFVKGDANDEKRAEARGWNHKLLSFPCATGNTFGAVLDTTAGFIRCSAACYHYYQSARSLGIKFVFGEQDGAFASFLKEDIEAGVTQIIGLRTQDGKRHLADTSVIAELSYHVESSGGTITRFKIDPDDTELWAKYSPEQFPVITWKVTDRSRAGKDVGSVYVFPRTEEGIIKIGYRGVKYTNFVPAPDEAFSLEGKWSIPAKPEVKPPQQALDAIETFVSIFLPEFKDTPFYSIKFCWYTDSLDNEFLIDYVPSYANRSLFVCTAGSGHGAKFLPVLGEHAADIFKNGDNAKTPMSKFWKWRADSARLNGLEDGPQSARNLKNLGYDLIVVKFCQ